MTGMKKLTAFRVDVEGIDAIGYAKLEGIIKGYIKGDGRIAHSYWIGILASVSFIYDGDKTRYELFEEITKKMQAESIPGRITEFKEVPLGKVADEKYAPSLKLTKLDESKNENKNK